MVLFVCFYCCTAHASSTLATAVHYSYSFACCCFPGGHCTVVWCCSLPVASSLTRHPPTMHVVKNCSCRTSVSALPQNSPLHSLMFCAIPGDDEDAGPVKHTASNWRKRCQDKLVLFVTSPRFGKFVVVVILLNTIALATVRFWIAVAVHPCCCYWCCCCCRCLSFYVSTTWCHNEVYQGAPHSSCMFMRLLPQGLFVCHTLHVNPPLPRTCRWATTCPRTCGWRCFKMPLLGIVAVVTRYSSKCTRCNKMVPCPHVCYALSVHAATRP